MHIRRSLCLTLSLLLAAVAAAVALPNGAGGGIQVNKDLTNLGPVADDFAIVLTGAESITQTFDGHTAAPYVGWFGAPTVSTVGGNTVIHWQGFNDYDDSRIDNGQTIHVGLSTGDGTHQIADMYWTGPDGRRLSGSVVYDIDANVTYKTNVVTWTWANNYADTAANLAVSNVRFAVFGQPLALGDLTNQNAQLAGALRPLSQGFGVAPGGAQTLTLPAAVAPGSAVVVVYTVSAPGSGALVTDFLQTVVGGAQPQ